jgi:hypothetical protein
MTDKESLTGIEHEVQFEERTRHEVEEGHVSLYMD